MPTQPRVSPGVDAINRARAALGNVGTGVRNLFNRQIEGARNSIPGTRNHDWRQSLDAIPGIPGDWFDSRTGRWQNPLTGRDFGGPAPQPGAPLMAGQPPARAVPPAAAPSAPLPTSPNYTDPNAWGPPETMRGNAPLRPQDPTVGRQGSAGRHGTTVLEGRAAQDFTRSIGHSRSGLGASSYGRDLLHSTQREG